MIPLSEEETKETKEQSVSSDALVVYVASLIVAHQPRSRNERVSPTSIIGYPARATLNAASALIRRADTRQASRPVIIPAH